MGGVNYVVVSLILCDDKWLSASNINGRPRGSGDSCNVLSSLFISTYGRYRLTHTLSREIAIEKISLPGPIQAGSAVGYLALLFRRKLK